MKRGLSQDRGEINLRAGSMHWETGGPLERALPRHTADNPNVKTIWTYAQGTRWSKASNRTNNSVVWNRDFRLSIEPSRTSMYLTDSNQSI